MSQTNAERARVLAQNLVEILTSYEEELMAIELEAPAMGQLRRAVGITIAEACYLITDGHYKTFESLMTETPWESYGAGNDPRCEHCMVHCGVEPSAALGINVGLADTLKMLAWTLS